ncbi:unnamed protein product [Paramecium primaurelia]|uniref:Acyl-coenzyme A oxidase n=1 Tax=Paramecium primaurelia TaxID=5886 RepID=A0A8S1L8E3_PARPR|nr:unnamed protein product [Paramecium primaurelia]
MSSEQRVKLLQQQFEAYKEMNEQISNPIESLQYYRQLSTIDKQKYIEIFYGRNWKYRQNLFDIVKNNQHVFKHHHLEESTREEQRYHSFQAMRHFHQKLGVTYDMFLSDPNIVTITSVAMYSFDPAVCVKFGVHFSLYTKTILNLGTDKHKQYFENAQTLTDIGSFSLTELGHGSNVRQIQTTAVYDKDTQTFIINTPTDLAIKFWIGATANLANMTVVFAQLYIDGKQYGVHAFLIEIRDKTNHNVKSGITIGDCGPKNGLNGIDNGFLIFKNVRVPLANMLDKFATVTPSGEFKTSIEDPDKRFAVQLASLSGGRIILTYYGAITSLNALTIGIRYAAIRKQFGLPGEKEQSILEYPLTQLRLIVPLAQTLVYIIAAKAINNLWDTTQNNVFNPNKMAEIHALSSVLKGKFATFANKVILECRQILGGHGYHSFNRLGVMLQDQDINNTWEGDSNVLMQQTLKFCMDQKNRFINNQKPIQYPSLKFLETFKIRPIQFLKDEDYLCPNNIQYLLEYKLDKQLNDFMQDLTENLNNNDMLKSWNLSYAFKGQQISNSYADLYCFQQWQELNLKNDSVLERVFQIWCLTIFENETEFYKNNEFNISDVIVKRLLMKLSNQLKDEAIGIIDALAPPDEILGSIFGSSDGDIYNKFIQKIYSGKNTFQKVPWWEQIHNK